MVDDIILKDVKKNFKIPRAVPKQASRFSHFFSYLFPDYKNVVALKNISFSIRKGERVALIGPNGAGKSTTIKILSGILKADSGIVNVLGENPLLERKKVVSKIGAVFGHSSQLWSYLQVLQSYEMLAAIYCIEKKMYQSKLRSLVHSFSIEHLLHKPVVKLSLGERMRCEIVASLLHSPEVLLFDEPTIGLDLIAKANLRDVILNLVKENNTTLLLSSHDISDLEKICDRAIIINNGSVVVDDSIFDIKDKYIKNSVITIVSDERIDPWYHEGTSVIKHGTHNLTVDVDLRKVSKEKIAYELLRKYSVKDIKFEDQSLEHVIRKIYEEHSD